MFRFLVVVLMYDCFFLRVFLVSLGVRSWFVVIVWCCLSLIVDIVAIIK